MEEAAIQGNPACLAALQGMGDPKTVARYITQRRARIVTADGSLAMLEEAIRASRSQTAGVLVQARKLHQAGTVRALADAIGSMTEALNRLPVSGSIAAERPVPDTRAAVEQDEA